MRRSLVLALFLGSCGKAPGAPSPAAGTAAPPVAAAPGEVSTLGSVEVTARLIDITGTFPPNKLYDYVYVMKYQVEKTHRGKTPSDLIFVGHYNPLKPRSRAQDKFSGRIGGSVEAFRVGDIHRLALESPLDQAMPMVGLIDKYIQEKGIRYWAIWTDRGAD
ncbi:MAG TPA: hypothetical protein VEN81_14845 [Planctomycetota bacterium]|nr:hypothetical protein [Planctomycetota bacterium]